MYKQCVIFKGPPALINSKIEKCFTDFKASQNDHNVIAINNVIKIYRLHNSFHMYKN